MESIERNRKKGFLICHNKGIYLSKTNIFLLNMKIVLAIFDLKHLRLQK